MRSHNGLDRFFTSLYVLCPPHVLLLIGAPRLSQLEMLCEVNSVIPVPGDRLFFLDVGNGFPDVVAEGCRHVLQLMAAGRGREECRRGLALYASLYPLVLPPSSFARSDFVRSTRGRQGGPRKHAVLGDGWQHRARPWRHTYIYIYI